MRVTEGHADLIEVLLTCGSLREGSTNQAVSETITVLTQAGPSENKVSAGARDASDPSPEGCQVKDVSRTRSTSPLSPSPVALCPVI